MERANTLTAASKHLRDPNSELARPEFLTSVSEAKDHLGVRQLTCFGFPQRDISSANRRTPSTPRMRRPRSRHVQRP